MSNPSSRSCGTRLPWLLPIVVALAGCSRQESFAQGIAAWHAANFAKAQTAFESELTQAGDRGSAALLFNASMAALQAGDLRHAEIHAETMAVRGGRAFYGRRDFLLGNVAMIHAQRTHQEAQQPNADPTALELALSSVEQARAFWHQALKRRSPWPQATRNLALAQRLREDLEQLKKARDSNDKSQKTAAPEQPPPPQPSAKTDKRKPDNMAPDAQASTRLGEKDLQRLLARLAEQEEQKRNLRQAQARRRTLGARDW